MAKKKKMPERPSDGSYFRRSLHKHEIRDARRLKHAIR